METKQAIQASMDMSLHIFTTYLSDLNDEELMQRPQADCNHLAWQIGHLIASEVSLLESVCPGKAAELPEGFADKHSKETVGEDDPSKFCSKQEYMDLFETVRAATKKALEEIPDADLDGDAPEWIREMFPTVGHMFTLIGTHPMMHAGQLAVARRVLGKPVLI